MKPHQALRISSLIPTLAAGIVSNAFAADLYWDANGATSGTGNSGTTTSVNTWSNVNTWHSGSATGTLRSWVNGNTAVLGGTAGTITLSTTPAIGQIRFLTSGYSVGAAAAGPISFSGSYSDSVPTIDTSGGTLVSGKFDATVSAKITGTPAGGVVIKDINNITPPSTSGRVYLNNAANSDFTGDVTILSGNLHVLSNLGVPSNKIILKGGALYGNAATTYTITRTVEVAANSGIGTRGAAGTSIWDFTGPITGSANLTRYGGTETSAVNVNLKGDMSGFSGTFENIGASNTGYVSIETTSTSAGAWKLTSGTVRLNTTSDTHIANGTGKSDLVINGGTLDMNGKSETINGLSGIGGVIQNQLAATVSTLTLGDGDATASYSGTIRDNGGTGGTVALTKTGGGVQTLGGTSTYTGDTLVSGGTLLVSGALGNTAVTVGTDARIGGGGTLGGTLHFDAGAEFQFSTTQTLTVNGAAVTFGGFSIADIAGLDSTADNGTYTLIGGTALVSTTNLANVGFANAYDLGNGKAAFFEIGSLKVTVVPEPGAFLLGGLELMGFLRRRRA
ncbi:MAG: hypothetical protein J0M04_15710 [Verrucomicrobia bacterium]|nr:hypothetical protein [Verrucomicrobiota bacterium]